MADIAQYSNFYSINPSTGEVTFNHSSVYTAPFTVVTSPSGESELMEIETGGGNFLGLLFAGVDDQNNIFAEDGNVYFTNAVYSVGSFVPNYAETYASRDTNAYVACFLSDTMILTPNGKCAVQRLAIGDMVSTSDGRSVPVKWIGRQTVATLFGGNDKRAPVCIDAGALDGNLPIRDLKLTADHALLIDGVLVQAGALVNGMTIRRMTQAETGQVYTVFHIETEDHEIILAEGCPAETFVDNVTRRRFDNYAEYEALFGDEAETILELDLPRVLSARQLPPNLRDLIAIRRAA